MKKHQIYDDDDNEGDKLLGFTVDIVTAHLAHNNVALADVPGFINQVHGTLAGLGGGQEEARPGTDVFIFNPASNPIISFAWNAAAK